MYYVTYKNVLKANKKQKDFFHFLEQFWPVQQRWGAIHYDLWNILDQGRRIFYCRCTVPNIEQWNRCAMSPEGMHMNEALSKIVEMDQISLKISTVQPEYHQA